MTYTPQMPESKSPFYHLLPDFGQTVRRGIVVPQSPNSDDVANHIARAYGRGQSLPVHSSAAYIMLGKRPVDIISEASVSLSPEESVYVNRYLISVVRGRVRRDATPADIERAIKAIEAFDGISFIVNDTFLSHAVVVRDDIRRLFDKRLRLLGVGYPA